MIGLNRTKKTNPIGFASFLFGLTFLTQLFQAFNTKYYNLGTTALITFAWASAAKIVFIVVDWLNDIIFSAISERINTKWGKRAPWLVIGSVFIPLFIFLTYFVDSKTPFTPTGFGLYYIFISILFENASTVMYTSYNALFPTLFDTTNERNKASMFKHIFEAIGMGACFVLTPILIDEVHMTYWHLSLLYSVPYFVTLIIMFRSSRLQDDVKASVSNRVKFSIRETMKDAFTDKSFIFYNLAQSATAAIMALVITLYQMYFKFVIKMESGGFMESLCYIVIFVCLLVSLPIWRIVIKKFGHVKVWLTNFTLMPFVLLILLIPTDYVSGMIILSIIAIGFGGTMSPPDMIFAEIIDLDKLKHHVSREAALGSIGNLIQRVSVIISAIFVLALTKITGYESAEVPGRNPEITFRIAFGVIMPAIALFGTVCAWLFYKFSKEDRKMLHALKKKSLDQTTEVSINDIINDNTTTIDEVIKNDFSWDLDDQSNQNKDTPSEDKSEDNNNDQQKQ